MAAWYISRVDSLICRVVYYLCVFSMVVPFQMVMFTLAKTADTLKLNTPVDHPHHLPRLRCGPCRVHVHRLCQVHPAATSKRPRPSTAAAPCSTFFQVVLPMLKPTLISVGVLEIMWVWNDYLLPYLVLDINEVSAPSPSTFSTSRAATARSTWARRWR